MYLSQHLFQHVHQWNRPANLRFDGDIAAELGYLQHISQPYIKLSYTDIGITRAIENGHLDILKWLRENRRDIYDIGCFSTYTHGSMDWAAECGKLDILKWMHENNEVCSSWAAESAAVNKNFDCVKWFLINRFKDCHFSSIAINTNGNLKMMSWLYENYPNECHEISERLLYDAAIFNQLDALKWLVNRENFTKACIEEAILLATIHHNPLLVYWLNAKLKDFN